MYMRHEVNFALLFSMVLKVYHRIFQQALTELNKLLGMTDADSTIVVLWGSTIRAAVTIVCIGSFN